MTATTHDDTKDFIAKYRAALMAHLCREELALYLGILPRSLLKRRSNLELNAGTTLGMLPSDPEFDGSISVEKVDEFEAIYEELIYADVGPTIVDKSDVKQKVYVVTAAQNATPIHEEFFSTLLTYCDLRNAELIVLPYRYKNPTSLFNDKDADYWWVPLEPYLENNVVKLCNGLQIMRMPTQPTAARPLSALDAITGMDSGIMGHPKVEQRTVPTPSKKMAKILATTGACTVENYTDSKAGHKGKFHHNIAALIVEVDGDRYHMRRVHGDNDGSFYDLEYHYTTQGRSKYGNIAALVPGDIHTEFLDPEVEKATFLGPDSMLGVLNPDVRVYHDLDDFYRRNHHHKGNDVVDYGKHHNDMNNVEVGLQISADFVDKYNDPTKLNIIPAANHLDAFDRWLREADPKEDPENARFYYYMKYHQLDNVVKTDTGFSTISAFDFWANNPLDQRGMDATENTIFLKRDAPYEICGIELAFHGDDGLNGGRGSIASYTKIGPKSIIGHSHSPGIMEGVYQVGVSARLHLEYARGPSSWLHTHCIVYPNGSRALINVISGEWRASYYDREYEI